MDLKDLVAFKALKVRLVLKDLKDYKVQKVRLVPVVFKDLKDEMPIPSKSPLK